MFVSPQENDLLSLDRRRFLKAAGVAGLAFACRGSAALEKVDIRKKLIVHETVPMNAEPALADLVQSWLTPIEHFYVRSHAAVPQINESDFQLSVEGLVHKSLKMTVGELRDRFPKKTVVATLTCAGNRRSEHSLVKAVKGVPWQAGAIGNAEWSGTPLSELLKHAGVKDGAKHVWFEGVDRIERGDGVISFGGSIPLDKAVSDTEQMPGALLAYEMNGEKLAPDHGFPLRTVVPGYIGARSVKWLGRIVVSDRPSSNYYLAGAYKIVTEDTDQQWRTAEPIYQFPINAVICSPANGANLVRGKVMVSGYALASAAEGRTISRVEVSPDNGRTWSQARFTSKALPYCWCLWEAAIPITEDTTSLVVRATDSAGHVQPETVDWNLKGYLFNAWHRTTVKVAS